MNKDEILVPILTAINDLREEVRENRRAIKSLEKRVESLEKRVESLEKRVESLEKRVESLENRMEKHEEQRRKDKKALLDILCSYEQVTNRQYEECKLKINKIDEKVAAISA